MSISDFTLLRIAERYSSPMEPPESRDEIRDNHIEATEEQIWADADWLESACAYNQVLPSVRLCQLISLCHDRVVASDPANDDFYREIVRELIACIDKEVRLAAERHVDDCDGDYTGDAA